MNITLEKADEQVKHLRIYMEKADYYDNVETALKKHRRTAQIPGFRVGNAPMGMIKRNYEKPLIAEEVNKLANEKLYHYFQDNNINIMFEPVLLEEESVINFESNEDFVFTFEFAPQPEFELDFASLPLIKTFKILANKEEIEDYKTQIRKRHGDYIKPDTIEADDYLTIKWGKNENSFLFVKDLTPKGKEAFLGKKLDDVVFIEFNEMFTSEENLKKFLKKTDDLEKETLGSAEITIVSIGRVDLAEMNEAFFKKAFPDGDVNSVEEFDKLAAQQIEIQWKQESDRKFMNDAITLLIRNLHIELPEDFIKRFILKNNEEITEEKLLQDWNQYIESFKWQLIESKLGKEGNIEVTIDEIKNHIRNYYFHNYFAQFNMKDVEEQLNKMVEEAVKDKKQVKQLYDQLFDNKIMQVLQSKMNVEELSGDFQQFIAFMTGPEYVSTTTAVQKQKSRKVKEKNAEEKQKTTKRAPAKKKLDNE
ncbi:MAG: hypothetical protein LBI45_06285 [Bacteroidales bacterium]|jgi:trigger factor|nr:hypothetical protein [Bacteroidales bacterium]